MSGRDSAFAYHQSTAFGASAVGQIVALYDTILRDMHRAIAALDGSQVEERVNATNHALTVIGELQGVLDFERGGEPARNLSDFYTVSRSLITEGSVSSSREKLKEVIAMFTRLRAAWSQAEPKLGPSGPTQEFRITSRPQAAISPDSADQAEDAALSSNGRWSA